MLATLATIVVIVAFALWLLAFIGKNVPHSQRRPRAVTPPPAPRQVSPALKAELDQTPEWWIDRFHKGLRATGAPHVGGEEWELHTFSGPVYMHREVGYLDCPCHNCRRICR